MNEAEFEIPADWADRSVNIFAVGNTPPLPLSFVISRDELKKGQELADFADEKLDELGPQLQQFNLLEKRQVEVAGELALDAEFTWRSDKGPMHQRQTYVRCGQRVLVFTVTAPRSLRDEHRAQVDALLASLKLRE